MIGGHGETGPTGPQGPPGEPGETGPDWDGEQQVYGLMDIAQNLLRHVEAVREAHDALASNALMEIMNMEAAVGMNNSTTVNISNADLDAIKHTLNETRSHDKALSKAVYRYMIDVAQAQQAILQKSNENAAVKNELSQQQDASRAVVKDAATGFRFARSGAVLVAVFGNSALRICLMCTLIGLAEL